MYIMKIENVKTEKIVGVIGTKIKVKIIDIIDDKTVKCIRVPIENLDETEVYLVKDLFEFFSLKWKR